MLQLPPLEEVKRPEMLDKLTEAAASSETRSGWEAGAQSNFMIAAARLGLRVASAANLGQDVYGNFLRGILKVDAALIPAEHDQPSFMTPHYLAGQLRPCIQDLKLRCCQSLLILLC